MRVIPLSQIIGNFPVLDRRGPEVQVSFLFFDSREAGPGGLFFALPGTHTDGHRFIPEVLEKGAVGIVHSQPLEDYRDGVAYLQVEDTRFAMSPFSAAFFGHPSRELKVIGVTGTDGKSSTTDFIFQLLTLLGHKTGFFSTVQYSIGQGIQDNHFRQSTPEAPQIHGLLRDMVNAGCTYAVVESTSHGLSPKTNRLGDVAYDAAVFTNVTSEHLEFHGTLDQYRKDKSRLFSLLDAFGKKGFGVVNQDDPWYGIFVSATSRPCRTYSLEHPGADLRAQDIQETEEGLRFTLVWQGRAYAAQAPLSGIFNVQNLMAALLAVQGLTSESPQRLVDLLSQVRGVKGRMKLVNEGQKFRVIVDYAHTPGAFEKVLPDVRATTQGRLLVVFGSGGERDRVKRPLQGHLADRWADLIYLTDEDPRLEDPEFILEEIAEGVKNKVRGQDLWLLRPRKAALAAALREARTGDTVLLLGKGHESSIITRDGKEPWDEEQVAREILKTLESGR